MTSASEMTRLVPGFDFLQGLMKGGGAGLPSIGQWIAPTLEPAELQRRIDELRTVQFWLDQNSKLIGTTIQALEVQRMTLATLKGMNLQMADLAEALTLKPGAAPAQAARPKAQEAQDAQEAQEAASPKPAAAPKAAGSAGRARRTGKQAAAPKAASDSGAHAVDPMQWWGALTQQFTELAAKALRDGSAEVARNVATGAAAAQGAAGDSIERAMAMSRGAGGPAAKGGTTVAPRAGSASPTGAARTGAGRAAPAARRRRG